VFDTKTNLVTMLGGVVLTQGKNVLRGDRLLVDMTTGVSRWNPTAGACRACFNRRARWPGDTGNAAARTPARSERLK